MNKKILLVSVVVMAATLSASANDPPLRVDDLVPAGKIATVADEYRQPQDGGAKVDDLAPPTPAPVQAPRSNEEPPVSEATIYQQEPHRCAPRCDHGPDVIRRETTRIVSRTTNTVRYVPAGVRQLQREVSGLRLEVQLLRKQVAGLQEEIAKRPTSLELRKQLGELEGRLAKKISAEADTTRKLISAEAEATRNHTSAKAEVIREAVDSQGLKIATIVILSICLIAVTAAVAYSANRQDPQVEEC